MNKIYYWDKETQKMIPGFPPSREVKFGDAPFVISDTLKKSFYHHGACKWTDSRSEINQFDKATKCFTTDKMVPGNKNYTAQKIKERHDDIHKSMHKAVAQLDAGTAPLSEETRAMCERQNEVISQALNFDAFNVAGKKTNEKGKRYRRR